MRKEKKEFCIECRNECEYEIKKVLRNYMIKDKEYTLEVSVAFCKECGEEMNIHGIMDLRMKEIDEQYRKLEGIVSIADIEDLMKIYNIGKAPLSLALGFGEITITRYLHGQIPSKEYSDIIKKALESSKYMIELLNENKEKVGETAYLKAVKAAEDLKDIMNISPKMLSTISYIFEKANEVTPLALQKLLYFIQGIYMMIFNEPMYEEDCFAWVHGPVYENVYNAFKSFQYNPIDDYRFVILKNRFKELSNEEKHVIDLVLDTFGMYSGKTLEKITHKEKPWIEAREGYTLLEPSHKLIEKEDIRLYFENTSKEYNLSTIDGINEYINMQLNVINNL